MWELIAVMGCLIGLAVVLSRFREIDDGPTRLLLLGLWLRYAMQAFPYVVTSIKFGPFSLIAAVSITTAILFLIFLDHRLLRLRALLPVYALLAVSLLSGVVNDEAMGMANDFIKWGYFIGVMLLSHRAMTLYGPDRALRALLTTLITPGFLFVASVVTGNVKATEMDGSISYIGGYLHEAMFSQIMLSIFALGILVRWRTAVAFASIFCFGVVAVMLANYRSTVIALAPVLLALAALAFLRCAGSRFAAVAIVALAVPVLGSLPFALDALPERYAEISNFSENFLVLSKDPIELTIDERRIFSGRVSAWVDYFYYFRQGDLVNYIIGYGPNAYERSMRVYAHNTYISTVWETGFVGLFTIIYLVSYFFILPFRVDNIYDRVVISSLMLSTVVIGLASMPLWRIEGLIFYAQVVAFATWRASESAARGNALRRATAPHVGAIGSTERA